MPPKSISNRRRIKIVRKPKQEWRVKQSTRNWLELPSDLMLNILQRVDVIDRLRSAQKVCSAWHEICKDPAMWRVIRIDVYTGVMRDMCKLAVDRSQGQLLDLTIIGYCDDDLLQYVVDRSSQLRRLEIARDASFESNEKWSEAFKKISLLEELSLEETQISRKDIEAAGRCCPLLKTLKLNRKVMFWDDSDAEESTGNDIALAIGKNLTELTHLELIGNSLTNTGLEAILDGCCHLELLDLRRCLYLDLEGDLKKRCLQQIKCIKLPRNSITFDRYMEYDDGCDVNDLLDDMNFESVGEMMAFMNMFD